MNEQPQTLPPAPYDDDIAIRALIGVLWSGKWLIGGITFAATVISVIVALLIPNIYRAEALLAPNHHKSSGGLSALAAQYGGLASLAGIDIGTAGAANKTALGLEVLKSRKFISAFIERHDILVPLMAAKDWNSETGELVVDSSVYDIEAKKWVRKVRPPKKAVPSTQEAYEEFTDILAVSQDMGSGFVTVSIQHYSPLIAKQWVDELVGELNSTIMRQDVAEAEQAIEYLHQQIAKTSLADLQNVFFRLIEEQTKTMMLARVSDEYLLKTLDPAIAPEKRSRPNRRLIVVLATLLGFLLGSTVAFVIPSSRK